MMKADAVHIGVATNVCACDFCTGKKRYEDNWCAYCADVKMSPPKWWGNMDVCDACERLLAEAPVGDGFP